MRIPTVNSVFGLSELASDGPLRIVGVGNEAMLATGFAEVVQCAAARLPDPRESRPLRGIPHRCGAMAGDATRERTTGC
jgi:hypothetical protein